MASQLTTKRVSIMNYELQCQKPISKKLVELKLGTAFSFHHGSQFPVYLVSSVSYIVRKEEYIPCYDLKSNVMWLFEEDSIVYPLSTNSTLPTFKYLSNEIQFKELN